MKKTTLLNLNHIGGKTGSAQFIDTLMQGLPAKQFDFHNLVGYEFLSQKNTTSLYATTKSWRYRNLRYKGAIGLNFLFDWMTPGAITIDYLHHFKPYQDADIIHLHCPQGGYFDWKDLPQICKEKKVVMTMHDDWIVSGNDPENLFHPYKTKSQYLKRRNILEKCTIQYIGVSNRITNKVIKDGIIGTNSVMTIYNGINVKVFYKRDKKLCRQELGLPLNKKIIISIAGSGGKSNAKGLQYVNQVIKNYQYNPECLFITLGNFKEKKVSENLREIGYVSQEKVAKYFNAADIFLYPTLMDSFGLVVAESLACACPVVAFQTGGVPEIITHKCNGYVAKRKDYIDLIHGFKWAINQPFTNISLDSTFTQKQMTEQYVQLYHTLSIP